MNLKLFIFFIILALLFSCNKKNVDISPEYLQLVGTWQNTGSPKTTVEIFPSKIIVKSSLNKMEMKILRMSTGVEMLETVIRIGITKNKNVKKSDYQSFISYQVSTDTIRITSYGVQSDNPKFTRQ